MLNKLRMELSESGQKVLKAYLSLVENVAPFMMNGIADSMSSVNYKVETMNKQQDIADIENIIQSFREMGVDKNNIIIFLKKMPTYHYLKDEFKEIVEKYYD